jgi:hypothetical protein
MGSLSEAYEMKMFIECDGSLVLCIHDDGYPSDVPRAQTTPQRVHEKKLTVTLSALILINGKAAQKDRGH